MWYYTLRRLAKSLMRSEFKNSVNIIAPKVNNILKRYDSENGWCIYAPSGLGLNYFVGYHSSLTYKYLCCMYIQSAIFIAESYSWDLIALVRASYISSEGFGFNFGPVSGSVNSMLITGTITAKQKVRQKSQAFTRFAGRFQSHTSCSLRGQIIVIYKRTV